MADLMGTAQCTARAKRTGERCRRRPIPGGRVCWLHGGAAGQVQAAAQRRVEAAAQMEAAREAVRRFGLAEGERAPADLDPRLALSEELWRSWRVVRQLEAEVAKLSEVWGPTFHATGRTTGEGKPHVAWAMWSDARSHLKAVAQAAHQAGVEDYRTAIEASSAALIASLFRAVFSDPDLNLAPDQRDVALTVAARHLRLLESGDDGDGTR